MHANAKSKDPMQLFPGIGLEGNVDDALSEKSLPGLIRSSQVWGPSTALGRASRAAT
jgi:hypothetical protein